MSPVIRTLGPDEKISEEGLWNIDLSVHHGQPCDGPSVTSGVLRAMTLRSPEEVWAFSPLNPNRFEKKDSDALRLGRAMAAFVEAGQEGLARHFALVPEGAPRRPTAAQRAAFLRNGFWSEAAQEGAAFWEPIEASGKTVVSAAEWMKIVAMGTALRADPAAGAVMSGEPELTMAWRDERTGLWVLSRPDTVSFDGSMSDYKRVSTQGRPFTYSLCDQRIEQHGYTQQMALAAEAFERVVGEWPTSVGLVFQCDEPPFSVILREIDEEALRYGQFLNHRALLRFAECLSLNDWPGPGRDVGAYRMSPRVRERMAEDMQDGGTP